MVNVIYAYWAASDKCSFFFIHQENTSQTNWRSAQTVDKKKRTKQIYWNKNGYFKWL